MKVWLDTEFLDRHEDGRDVLLISLGAVREDGHTFYMESVDFDESMASPWLWKHVIPHLQGPRHTPARIAEKFLEFCGNNPEFWGYYCAWDWWLVCKLFGGFMKLPPTWPAWCNDINTLHVLQKYTRWNPPKQTTANHHALNDAIWTRDAYNHLLDTACLTSP